MFSFFKGLLFLTAKLALNINLQKMFVLKENIFINLTILISTVILTYMYISNNNKTYYNVHLKNFVTLTKNSNFNDLKSKTI